MRVVTFAAVSTGRSDDVTEGEEEKGTANAHVASVERAPSRENLIDGPRFRPNFDLLQDCDLVE